MEISDSENVDQLKKILVHDDTINTLDFAEMGFVVYDNGYLNTAVCRSSISYIDGEKGILRYRGYDIAELAEQSSFLEVAYLLIFGQLPNQSQFEQWSTRMMRHTFIHENLIDYLRSFRYNSHPMGILISGMAALSTLHPEASTALNGEEIYDNEALGTLCAVFINFYIVNKQIFRCLGKLPTIAGKVHFGLNLDQLELACAYRHRIGRSYNSPSENLEYTENFLYMLDRLSESNYAPHPKLAHALDVIFILHADHELNCSTSAMRQMASTGIDPFICLTGAASALYGPSHGMLIIVLFYLL